MSLYLILLLRKSLYQKHAFPTFYNEKPLIDSSRAAACATMLFAGIAFAQPAANGSTPSSRTDAQVRQILIDKSIEAYPGNCPCPYNTMRNGRACGKRSAWNKPGGYAPLCYAEDVSDEQVAQSRQDNDEPRASRR